MNKETLKAKLDELKIDCNFYSLEGDLLPDRMILKETLFAGWHVFYMDERGNQEKKEEFKTEEEACDYSVSSRICFSYRA